MEKANSLPVGGNKGGVTRSPGEGRSFWVLGDLYTIKVEDADTGGKYAAVEATVAPQNGPPPHIHHREDESFYVLEGELSFLVGDRTILARAGSYVYVPQGMLHTFKNVGMKAAKLLVTIAPAGFEKLFEEIGEPATNISAPPPLRPGVVEKLMALAARYHLEVPPPA